MEVEHPMLQLMAVSTACRLLMFHGPIKAAVPFFESMGFRCPDRKDHASFLQEVTTPKGRLLKLPDISVLPSGCLPLTCISSYREPLDLRFCFHDHGSKALLGEEVV